MKRSEYVVPRQVRHAIIELRDQDGERHTARWGETVELPESVAEKLDAQGATVLDGELRRNVTGKLPPLPCRPSGEELKVWAVSASDDDLRELARRDPRAYPPGGRELVHQVLATRQRLWRQGVRASGTENAEEVLEAFAGAAEQAYARLTGDADGSQLAADLKVANAAQDAHKELSRVLREWAEASHRATR